MEEEWKEYKLCEVAQLLTGFPFDGHKYSKAGIRVVRGDNVTIGSLRWESEKDKRWNERFSRSNEFSLKEEDIVIGMDGSRVGRNRAQIKAKDLPLLLAQRVACIRNTEKSIQKFLYYQIFSNKFEAYIKSVQTGTSIPHVSLKQIGNFPTSIPSINTQRRIADILSSLDSKIELNRRINDNLEQQAQALFKAWFVDFEPFKDGKFVESELGMIPEGCRVGKAEDFYNINIGKTPPRKEQIWFSSNSSDYTWVSISDLGSCGRFVFTSSEFLTHEAIKRHNIILVPKDTILLSFKLTIGRVGIAGTELTTNEAIARFITSDENREYTYFLLKGYNYEKLGSTSSIATAVNSKIIKAMVVLMPDKEILKAFSSLTKPYFDQILRNEQESIRLTILRDTLLPKLMSGELKINATEVL
ncbi:restriction endonuclease subunit S [Bacteroides acidifaciens]|uniref:restriction endonuclease subunit S n=4 Tax=Bacteroides acidifaciens TaxID=85831 RepID=UPI002557EDF2|nr:restriction endonuclease subunit S [Bacteroides acidifaciens]